MKKILLLLLLPLFGYTQKTLKVFLTTDSYPTETYWIVFNDTLYGDTIAEVQAGHYTSANTLYTDTVILPDSIDNITFLIRDTYGDGMMAPGNFFVALCEDTIISVPIPNFIGCDKPKDPSLLNWLKKRLKIRQTIWLLGLFFLLKQKKPNIKQPQQYYIKQKS